VQDKGLVRIKDLKIGDMVSVGEDKFSRVYSFGHRNINADTEYLQIHVDGLRGPLEITRDHMVFVDKQGAVPASLLTVGEKVMLTNDLVAPVTSIFLVRRVGAFAPFTESGTLMVSGVLTSSYISMQEDLASFKIGGMQIASWHWLAHASQAPHRMVCQINFAFCESEKYAEGGISYWVHGPYMGVMWLVNHPRFLAMSTLSLLLVVAGITLYLLDHVFHPRVSLVLRSSVPGVVKHFDQSDLKKAM